MRSKGSGLAGIRLNIGELSGGLGDMGTFLPLALALCLIVGFHPGALLVWAGALNILTGFLFRLPFPVQPMKALAAVAIAGELTRTQVSAAGLEMALILIFLSASGLVRRFCGHIPPALVRGIQVGIGLKLAFKGLTFCAQPHFEQISGLLIIGLALGLIVAGARYSKLPAALMVFLAGLFISAHLSAVSWSAGLDLSGLRFSIPPAQDWWPAFLHGTLVQLPLTLLNSVVAVSALSRSLFPDQPVSETKISASVGVMNAVSCLFGGMPVCHGAGGLAAQYRFGARTGGSVVLLGALFIITGAFFSGAVPGLIRFFPREILGVMLLAASWELVRQIGRNTSLAQHFICGITALTMVLFEALAGFGAGLAAAFIISFFNRTKKTVPESGALH
jgi:MFS superfamily sulfate permease-like transporter